MKKENGHFKRKATMDRILRIWDQTPDMTLGQLIWKSTGTKHPMLCTDEEIVKRCHSYIKIYKEENSLKNRIKKGLKTCVTKMTLW